MVLEWIYDALFGASDKKTKRRKPRSDGLQASLNRAQEQAFERLEIKDPNETKREFYKTGVDVLKKVGTALTIASPPTTASGVASLLAKGDLLDKVEKLTFNNAFRYYGKYGGPSYSAGKYTEPGQIITSKDIEENPPDDELDKLYLEHDLRYQMASTESDAQKRKDETRRADEIFIRDAERLAKKGLDLMTLGALKASVLAFKAKLATDIGYNIDQETDPEAMEVAKKYFNLRNYDRANFIIQPLNQPQQLGDKFSVPSFQTLPKEQKLEILSFLLEEEDD